MRRFFIAITLAVICSCVPKQPYFDLRQPVYVMADKSFWLGCEGDTLGDKYCRDYRVEQVYQGFSQWFDYFADANRPKAVFVLSKSDLPSHPVNSVIHLGISEDFCGDSVEGRAIVACYSWGTTSQFSSVFTRIVFKNIQELVARNMAHEFGHALGMEDNYLPANVGSVMSYTTPTKVTAHDVKTMCRLHHECRMRKKHGGSPSIYGYQSVYR